MKISYQPNEGTNVFFGHTNAEVLQYGYYYLTDAEVNLVKTSTRRGIIPLQKVDELLNSVWNNPRFDDTHIVNIAAAINWYNEFGTFPTGNTK